MSAASLFGVPPGVDFAAAVISGLDQRYGEAPPETWGRMTLLVNSGRMARTVRAAFNAGPACLLPRILPVSDLDGLAPGVEAPAAMPRLRLILHLAQLLDALTDQRPDIAPKATLFDLSHTLADLIDELEGEGVGLETLDRIEATRFAEHWQTGRGIVSAAYTFIEDTDGRLPGGEARRRRIAEALRTLWKTTPPSDPVIVAGSTGSRGATRTLLEAVARLPNGAVILPGYDFGMPDDHWEALDGATTGEDHPQFRFRVLMNSLGLQPSGISPWAQEVRPPDEDRNALIGLALCPAPVTDRWRQAASGLAPLGRATARMSLLEAPNPRMEAAAIAVRLRMALHEGKRSVLISPDRELTRQVSAALERWGIEPDDSGGTPLQQTPPGRLLRMTAALMSGPPSLPELLAILKHPLTATGGDRGEHLLATRELELSLRRLAVSRPDAQSLATFGTAQDGRFAEWAEWVASLLGEWDAQGLPATLAAHVALTEKVAFGAGGTSSGELWLEATGSAAQQAIADLADAAPALSGTIQPHRYGELLVTHFGRIPVTDPRRPHPGVIIWGTLEARAGGNDLAILAGLNDGTWPDLPAPDPWLNRAMRREAGLLLPERQIGLAAHDFQQAVAAPEVMLTRSVRDTEAPTVPSRWLNRLTTLLHGLGDDGQSAVADMRARGSECLRIAVAMEVPDQTVEPAHRPAPRPPAKARPTALSVTQITTLIRDPYAIYARHILNLHKLAPLLPKGDARERGTALHEVMEAFLADRHTWLTGDPKAALEAAAQVHLARMSADPAIQTLWHARLMVVSDRLIEGEMARLSGGEPVLVEEKGALALGAPQFTLHARPDRIDRRFDGTYAIRDYKSGAPPSAKQVRLFDKQLPLEAAMAEHGAFPGLEAAPVSEMGYISLGVSGEDRILPMEESGGLRASDAALEGLRRLIARYAQRSCGYTAQRAAEKTHFDGDYDHLSRYGEWDLTDTAQPEDVGPPE